MGNRSISGKIKYISDRVRQRADYNLKSHGITLSQVRVLRFINDNGGSRSQKEIESFLQVSHPTVVGLVSRMEQSGILSTAVCTSDKRNKIVSVTDKGVKLSCELQKYMSDLEKSMFDGIDPSQLQLLDETLDKIVANLD